MKNPMYDPNGRIRFDGVEIHRCPLDSRPEAHYLKYYCVSGEPRHKNERIARKHIEFVKMDARKQNKIRLMGNLPAIPAHLYFSKNCCFLIKTADLT